MKKTALSLSVLVVYALYIVTTLSKGDFEELPRTVSPAVPVVNQAPRQPTSSTSTPTQAPSTPVPAPAPAQSALYKDGQYTGAVADAYYGNVQVQVDIHSGKIYDVAFLDHPQDRRTSIEINNAAMPQLRSEAIQAQSAQVDIVSGATATSNAFRESLASALSQAKN